MLLAPVGSEPSSLHSTTAHGRPLTKSTMSGMMNGLTRPGVSTRNWLIAMKWLRSGCAQSTSRTSGYSSPVRSLRPTTTRVWPISFRVTIWLASISGLPATSTVSSSCRLASCASVSQGEPSGRRLMPRTVSQKTRRSVTSVEVVAQAGRGVARNGVRSLVDHLPAERTEVVQEGLFDEEVFGHSLLRCAGCSANWITSFRYRMIYCVTLRRSTPVCNALTRRLQPSA